MATKLVSYLKKLSETVESGRSDLVELIRLKNYGSNELSENAMWILTTASKNNEYLTSKLQEELSLDQEAPSEEDEELTLDSPSEDDGDIPAEMPAEDEPSASADDLTFDDDAAPEEGGEGDIPSEAPAEGEEEMPAELDADEASDEETEEEPKIETSLAGVGILPLLAEIQEKLANGKPSEVELAALKAMKKLF